MSANSKGLFIVFEGGDGTGKTTQADRLTKVLLDAGWDVARTRDPGGSADDERTAGAKEIRKLLLTGDVGKWQKETELLLFTAARAELIGRVIQPALDRGEVVICDRFVSSTMAYQGAGNGTDTEMILDLHAKCCGNLFPDLTVLMDGPATQLIERARQRLAADGSDEGRYESADIEFHERLAERYRELARKSPQTYAVIDAMQAEDEAAQDVMSAVANLVSRSGYRLDPESVIKHDAI